MRTPSPWAILLLALTLLPAALAQPSPQFAPSDPVDINRASLSQLLRVPGMTPTWAGRILRFRPYRAKSDLVDRGVIPPNVYAHIREGIIAHKIE